MESIGERIVHLIAREEQLRGGRVQLEHLSERIAAYLDPPERERLLADAGAAIDEPVTDLADAFVTLLPVDKLVLLVADPDGRRPGFMLRPFFEGDFGRKPAH